MAQKNTDGAVSILTDDIANVSALIARRLGAQVEEAAYIVTVTPYHPARIKGDESKAAVAGYSSTELEDYRNGRNGTPLGAAAAAGRPLRTTHTTMATLPKEQKLAIAAE